VGRYFLIGINLKLSAVTHGVQLNHPSDDTNTHRWGTVESIRANPMGVGEDEETDVGEAEAEDRTSINRTLSCRNGQRSSLAVSGG
jgi:hypothetical protein